MPGRMIILIVCLVALTGFVLGQMSRLQPAPGATRISSSDEVSDQNGSIPSFYAAVNAVIATGDTSQLDSSIHPDFINRDFSGALQSRAEFEALLVQAHELNPSIALKASEPSGYGDVVAVMVEVQGQVSQPLGHGVFQPADSWRIAEFLRMDKGRVLERWADSLPVGGATNALSVNEIRISSGSTLMSVDRVTIEPGGWIMVERHKGSAVIVESGQAQLTIRGGKSLTEPIQTAHVSTIEAGNSFTVRAGDTGPTVLMLARVEAIRVSPDGNAIAFPSSPNFMGSEIVIENLGANIVRMAAAGTFQIQGWNVHARQGDRISAHVVNGAELVLVLDGELHIDVSDGSAVLYDESGFYSPADEGAEVGAGETLSINHGAWVAYQAINRSPVKFWIISLAPIG